MCATSLLRGAVEKVENRNGRTRRGRNGYRQK